MRPIQKLVPLLAAAALFHPIHSHAEAHSNLQAVTSIGTSAWNGAFPFTLRGVLLCDPGEMLDATPNFIPYAGPATYGKMGAEWQITFQAVEPGDRGGTTCWLGQNYGNQPWIRDSDFSYTNEAWVPEVLRVNFDPTTLHQFRAGDLIEVTARQAVFYGGKRNINENHDIDPAYNFDIRLITADYGLPAPEAITLADVVQPGGDPGDWTTWAAIFDPTRAIGGEHWQGMRVRLNSLTLVTTNGWNLTNLWPARLCTVTDGTGRYFRLRHPRYSLGAAPTGVFDAIGIFTQESGSGIQGTNGYELIVQQAIPQAPPTLAIAQNVSLTWADTGASYQLEYRTVLGSTNWLPVKTPPLVVNGQNVVLLPRALPQEFYRLRKTN
jgi:hypothetical protein